MGDVFREQIVARTQTAKDTAIKLCMWVLVVLIGVGVLMYFPGFALIIVVLLGVGAKFLQGYLNVEYEYIFTNGELDIDVIYDKSRRKRLFSGSVKSFEIMAHTGDRNHERAFSAAQETRDYSAGTPNENTYAFLTAYNGKKVKVIIEPNEKMLKAFSGALTGRILHLSPSHSGRL